MHHQSGIHNGLWTDMAIETTYMRYAHNHIWIIGIALEAEALKTWAPSIHAINYRYVLNDMNIFSDERYHLKSIIRNV